MSAAPGPGLGRPGGSRTWGVSGPTAIRAGTKARSGGTLELRVQRERLRVPVVNPPSARPVYSALNRRGDPVGAHGQLIPLARWRRGRRRVLARRPGDADDPFPAPRGDRFLQPSSSAWGGAVGVARSPRHHARHSRLRFWGGGRGGGAVGVARSPSPRSAQSSAVLGAVLSSAGCGGRSGVDARRVWSSIGRCLWRCRWVGPGVWVVGEFAA